MRLLWSFLRLALVTLWVVGVCLPEQATGEDAESVARSLGVSDVNDWDIRSLYRVRFQHITKRPPPAVRHAERKSNLATRWAALRERIADFFPSRHTNPRTVVTFDKIATDFVNVGIVKLAKALDPPKTPSTKRAAGRRRLKKGKATTEQPPEQVSEEVQVSTERPSTGDVRPKRSGVTLLVDLPDFELEPLGQLDRISRQLSLGATVPFGRPTTPHPLVPEALMQLAPDDATAYTAAGSPARGQFSRLLIGASVLISVLLLLLSARWQL